MINAGNAAGTFWAPNINIIKVPRIHSNAWRRRATPVGYRATSTAGVVFGDVAACCSALRC